MNKFKQVLMKDFGWKLLSLAIAICLWFIVINIEDPVETRNFSVTLEILNDATITDRGQIISNYDEIYGQKINIRVRGQRIALDRLYQNRDEIRAYIDLSTVDETPGYGETVPVPVVVKLPSALSASYEIEGKSPGTITLVVENRVSVEKTIVLDMQGGVDANYTLATPELSPKTVTVSGSQTMVDTVDTVKASVNIDNIKEDSHYTANLEAYDAKGIQVTGVNLSIQTVDVYVPVKMSKKVKLVYTSTGAPKDGYLVDDVTCVPEYVYVLGREETLKDFDEIILPSVNVEGKDADTSMTFGLKYFLQDGMKLKDGTNDKVVITVAIVKESTKTVTLKADNISFKVELDEGLSAEVAPEDITFDVRGSKEAIESLTDDQVIASLTVSNVEAGEYSMPLSVNLPEGVNLVGTEAPVITVSVVPVTIEPAVTENQ